MDTHVQKYEAAIVDRAATLLGEGKLVAVPTETVYGLAADASSDLAVAKIFAAKERPNFNPLIIHVSDMEMAEKYAVFSGFAKKLASAFWPGPLTLVLPRKADGQISHLVSAGLDTIGIRCPAAEPAQEILRAFGRPFAAPSANRSGGISPTAAAHVLSSLGDRVDLIVDAGDCSVGVESTILKVTDEIVELLRPGGLALEDIKAVVGNVDARASSGPAIQAPGMMASHYAPNASMTLNLSAAPEGSAFLGFGAIERHEPQDRNLSRAGDLVEAAANLFKFLHEMDTLAVHIAVAPIPMKGLGLAINDRLQRAAAPKE